VRHCQGRHGKTVPHPACSRAPTFPCPFPSSCLATRSSPEGERGALGDLPGLTVSPPSGLIPPSARPSPSQLALRNAIPSKKSKSFASTTGNSRAPARALREESARPGRLPQEPTCSLLEIASDNIWPPLGFRAHGSRCCQTGQPWSRDCEMVVWLTSPSYQCRPGRPDRGSRSQGQPQNSLKALEFPVWPTFPQFGAHKTKLSAKVNARIEREWVALKSTIAGGGVLQPQV